MHFITFPVASTNIFPLSNSTQGGQLVTEFNLKARDMVATNPNVKYPIGPSFLHCKDDFKVTMLQDTDVADYDSSTPYTKGTYCRYENKTYICIKNTNTYVNLHANFTGNGSETRFYFDANVGEVKRIDNVLIDGTSIASNKYSLNTTTTPHAIDFTTAPDNNAVISVDYSSKQPTTPANANYWTETSISTSIIQVGAGRAVINGHYVETLAPMQVDLNLANAELRLLNRSELFGNLSIGIKSFFSTETTMAGSMLVENADNMYLGIQLVIARSDEFTTPEDCPEASQEGTATADIKLADFTYINGSISASSINPNPNVTRFIPSERIYDFNSLLDDKYISSDNLEPSFIYTYGGNGVWCNSINNLMVWDKSPKVTSIPKDTDVSQQEAQFVRDTLGNVHFILPHKQPHGEILDPVDPTKKLYYADKDIVFPTADYSNETSGIITGEYTKHIKKMAETLTTYKSFTGGKQLGFWETLTIDENGKYNHTFPSPLTDYDVGDYIIVREDYTIISSEDEGLAPASIYFVLAGFVTALDYTATRPTGIELAPMDSIKTGEYTPEAREDNPIDNEEMVEVLKYITNFYSETRTYNSGDYVAYDGGTYKCLSNDTSGRWDPEKWEEVLACNAQSLFNFTSFTGTLNKDYFSLVFYAHDTEEDPETHEETEVITPYYYYYKVFGNGPKHWSDGVMLTGGIALATEDQIGGFYNASTEAEYTDAGYVYLDDTGHLKLVDYELLRSGALAYQLGYDYSVPSNQTLDAIQAYLDEAVNARVAFKTKAELTSTPTMLNINIPLPADEEGVINIYNLDSRFGTGVYLHFLTDDKTKDYSNITINISDCEKIRIDSSITTVTNGPLINVFRSCLYYDATVINYIRTCDTKNQRPTTFTNYTDFTGFDGLTLWYSKFSSSDPDLVVNGMEVSQPDAEKTVDEISFWDTNISGDNHYNYALRSITLSNYGSVIGCSLYVSNGTTVTDAPTDINTTKRIIIGGDFNLPQGPALNYPLASIDATLKVTGTFTTAYQPINDTAHWIVSETSFTATTGTYNGSTGISGGMIAFNSATNLVEATYTHGLTSIMGWQPGSYHIFYGGTTLSDDT